MQDLTDAIRRERELLEHLRYRFVTLELLVAAREARFLGWATRDVERARLRVRESDLVRAAEVGRLRVKGAQGIPTLREVAAVAAAPWAGILRDHHDSLSALVADIELCSHRIAQGCRDALGELARAGRLATPGRIPAGVLVGPDGLVDLSGDDAGLPGHRPAPGEPEALDPIAVECVLDDAIAAAGRMQIPALLAFLR